LSTWNWLFGDVTDATAMPAMDSSTINPATGLPMVGDDMSGIDVGGSPFGTDLHSTTDWTTCSGATSDITSGISGDWP